ncbi:hypothetical protein HK102_009559 [Quaeritorhiza haematococci]|nr:hypothetical protein HK102_009559 [Quaeritorhiza haematococci]
MGQPKEARDLALRILTHHPNVPFLYQVAAEQCVPPAECLSLAEKGLSILKGRDEANHFVRLGLLQAASRCEDLALDETVSNMPTDAVVINFKSALSYAEEYVSTSPPDMRDLRRMIVVVMWTALVLQEADEIASVLYEPSAMDQKVVTVKLIMRYRRSLVKWAKRFQYEWKEPEDDTFAKKRPTFFQDMVKGDLQFCSWCANPSVKLKKCTGCRIARYCNVSCQRKDWKQHKSQCKPKA